MQSHSTYINHHARTSRLRLVAVKTIFFQILIPLPRLTLFEQYRHIGDCHRLILSTLRGAPILWRSSGRGILIANRGGPVPPRALGTPREERFATRLPYHRSWIKPFEEPGRLYL